MKVFNFMSLVSFVVNQWLPPTFLIPSVAFYFGYLPPTKKKNIRPLLFHHLEALSKRTVTGRAGMGWLLAHRFDPII